MKSLLFVAGARPNFMKIAPVLRALESHPGMRARTAHTGQHHDPLLSDRIMRDLGLPEPDHHLGVGSGPPSLQTAHILAGLDPILERERPDAVVVVGDVTSSLAGALAAANRAIPLVHVEAGLRSFDARMPEERNRALIDRLASLLFASEPAGATNLAREGVERGVHLVGNVMIDSLLQILPRALESGIASRLGLRGPYGVLTLHRAGNTDDAGRLERALQAIARLAAEAPLVFPVHPRTRAALAAHALPRGLICTEPLGYVDFVGLLAGAALVLTDSGGVQEETTALGVPCLTLRPNTERPITVELGTNTLVDLCAESIQELGLEALRGRGKKGRVPELWDGRASGRIAAILAHA